jgi:hypothetical protein
MEPQDPKGSAATKIYQMDDFRSSATLFLARENQHKTGVNFRSPSLVNCSWESVKMKMLKACTCDDQPQ